jgi:hypothetical protein
MALRTRLEEPLLGGYAVLETLRGVAPELVAVSVSVAVGTGLTPTTLGVLLNAGFLFVAFYTFTPVVYPDRVGPRRERPGFRVVVSAVALSVAVPASLALTTFDTTVSYALVGTYLSLVALFGLVTFAVYFRLTQPRPLSDPDGDGFAVLRGRVEESAADHRRYLRRLAEESPRAATAVRWLSVVATMATYLAPCLLFGVGAATLDSLFPLLELLVIVALLLRVGRRAGVLNRSVPDVESRFYDRLTTAARSTRGTAGVMMVVVALLLATFCFSLWLRGGPRLWAITNGVRLVARSLGPNAYGLSVVDGLADLVAGVGVVVALPVASGYVVWYWLRELQRLTVFESDATEARVVARPPGLTVVVTALTVGWFAHATVSGVGDAAFAVGWPLLTGALVRNVRTTRRETATPPSETRWSVPVGFVVYAGGVVLSLVVFFDVSARMFLGLVVPVWLFYLGTVRERSTGLRRSLSLVGYGAALFLVVFALRGPLGVGGPVLAVLGGVVVALAAGQAFSHVFDPDGAGADTDGDGEPSADTDGG